MPEEGCMLWSTSMEIPVGAPNPQAAQAFMNYVYDPEVQADIAEYVNYVTPVAGVKEILRKRDPDLARNELIFPSEEYTAELHIRARARWRAGRADRDEGLPAGDRRLSLANALRRRTADRAGPRRSSGDARAPRRQVAAIREPFRTSQLLVLPELHLAALPRALEDGARSSGQVAIQIPGPLTERSASSLATERSSGWSPALSTSAAPTGRSHNTALVISPDGRAWSRAIARSSPGSRTSSA